MLNIHIFVSVHHTGTSCMLVDILVQQGMACIAALILSDIME